MLKQFFQEGVANEYRNPEKSLSNILAPGMGLEPMWRKAPPAVF
jgi:hypothetical protein